MTQAGTLDARHGAALQVPSPSHTHAKSRSRSDFLSALLPQQYRQAEFGPPRRRRCSSSILTGRRREKRSPKSSALPSERQTLIAQIQPPTEPHRSPRDGCCSAGGQGLRRWRRRRLRLHQARHPQGMVTRLQSPNPPSFLGTAARSMRFGSVRCGSVRPVVARVRRVWSQGWTDRIGLDWAVLCVPPANRSVQLICWSSALIIHSSGLACVTLSLGCVLC